MKSSKAFDLRLLSRLIFFLRKQYNHVRDKIDGLGPLVLTEYDFVSGIAHQTVKKSKHEVLNRELRTISGWIDCATHSVNTIEQQLCINTRWQWDDAKYIATESLSASSRSFRGLL